MSNTYNDVSIKMSHRLKAIADMLGTSAGAGEESIPVAADIGCDHGYVSIYLVQKGTAQRAIAMDVRKGPLEGAAENIRDYGLSDRIETRLSDGFKELKKGEADAAIIAGMGGKLMMRILEDGDPVGLGITQAVLQPQSDIDEFRHYLRDKGYTIADEKVIFDEGKYYFPMRVVFSGNGVITGEGGTKREPVKEAVKILTETTGCESRTAETICNRFGEHNILKRDELLREFLEHGREVSESILQNLEKTGHEERYQQLEEELREIKLLLQLF